MIPVVWISATVVQLSYIQVNGPQHTTDDLSNEAEEMGDAVENPLLDNSAAEIDNAAEWGLASLWTANQILSCCASASLYLGCMCTIYDTARNLFPQMGKIWYFWALGVCLLCERSFASQKMGFRGNMLYQKLVSTFSELEETLSAQDAAIDGRNMSARTKHDRISSLVGWVLFAEPVSTGLRMDVHRPCEREDIKHLKLLLGHQRSQLPPS